jgi:alginate O-acetyltransferase complex protein AlgI
MTFLSIQFLLFLATTVSLFWLSPSRFRPLFLAVASYVFYGLWSPIGALGLLTVTSFVFYAGLALRQRLDANSSAGSTKQILALSISILVAWLFLFKTLGLVKSVIGDASGNAEALARFLAAHTVLPLGISYYTFKLISYLLDVYWGKFEAEKNFVHFAAYVAFFPQIVAGPIQRSEDFLTQIRRLVPAPDKMRLGLGRILLGCFKKAVIADNLSTLIDAAYPHLQGPTSSALPAYYVFPIQLFIDFSALTDIAIGVALLFGIESPENFDRPFLASSISQYWRRWHMSLTGWLNDYVFLPLRMATRRAGRSGLVFSIMVNMLLIGIWHNLSWTFVVFGLLHGIFLVIDALTMRGRARFFGAHSNWDRIAAGVGPVFTFHLVALGMVFVRAESVRQAGWVLWQVFSLPTRAQLVGLLGVWETRRGLAGLALWVAFLYLSRQRWVVRVASYRSARWAFYYAVVLLIVRWGHDAEAFIYYKF